MLLDGAFRALLLPPVLLLLPLLVVISGSSAVIVPPPTNLSVSCKNFNVTASWEFSRQQPTVFSVDIRRAVVYSVIKTTDHQYNLTRYILPDESSYMDVFYVTVTAEQGSNRSEPVQSKTFSFNTLKTTDIKCKLEFPPVDLKWTDSGATVRFRNPFHVYSLRPDNLSAARVVFKASTNLSDGSLKTYSNKCTAKDDLCKLDVSFLDGVEKCVTLDGTLFASNNVGEIEFQKLERICVNKPLEDYLLILLAVLLSIAAITIGVIIVCVCLTKAWTMKAIENLPHPPFLDTLKQVRPGYTIVTDPHIVVVTVTGNNRKEEGKSTENLQDGGFCSDPEGGFLASSKREPKAMVPMYERNGMDDDSADSSVKTECVSLQSDELEEEEQQEVEEEVEPIPNYDRPQNLQMDNVQVDLGDGEMATAYLGRPEGFTRD